ncbi:ligand-binding sensor domain-containing protein [Parabacteroides sp.]
MNKKSVAVRYIALSLCLWFVVSLSVQGTIHEQEPIRPDPYARFISFTVQNGLSHDLVLDILQDKFGQMWFATKAGLTRFDGTHYTIYKNISKDPHSLSHNVVVALAEDSYGDLWVGTHDGLNKYDRTKDRFIRYKAEKGKLDGLQDNLIKALYADSEGILWIESQGGYLSRLDIKKQTWVHTSHCLFNNIEGEYYYHHIYEDSQHTLWVGGRLTSIARIPKRDTRLIQHPIPNADELYFDPGCFIETTNGVLLCSDYEGNLGRYNPETGSFNTILHLPLSATCAIRDEEGKIWIGGNGDGIVRLDFLTGKKDGFLNNPQKENTLLSNNVYCLYKDHDGNIWVGTDKGVSLYPAQLNKVRLYQHTTSPESLSENLITAVMQDRDGLIWVGTENNGVDTFSMQREKFGNLKYDLLTKNLTPATFQREKATLRQYFLHEFITSSYHTDIERILATYQDFRSAALTFKSLNENNVSALYEDKAGKIYIGLWSHVGFNVYDKKQQTFKRYALWSKKPDYLYPNFLRGNPFGSNWYNGFLEDSKSRFWCATWEGVGLNLFDRQKGMFTGKHYMRQAYPSGTGAYIRTIGFDPERNRIYMAGGRYFGYYDRTNRYFTQYTEILPNDYINRDIMNAYIKYQHADPINLPLYSINLDFHYDSKGHLWITGHDFNHNFVLHHTLSTRQTTQVLQTDGTLGFKIAPTTDGRYIYLCNDSSIYRITIDNQTVTRLIPKNIDLQKAGIGPIGALFADYRQELWIGTEKGLFLYHPVTGQIDSILPKYSRVTAITGLPSGDILMGCDTGLIWLRNASLKAVFPFSASMPKGLPGMSIQHINAQQSGILWISTNNGLVKFQLANQETTCFYHDELDPHSLPHNYVSCTFIDPSQKKLWVTTADGASILDLKDSSFSNLSTPDETSLSSRLASCILEDSSGNIWVGTTEKGLNRLNPETEKIKHFMFQPWDTTSLSHNHVHCLAEDRQKQIWIGTEKGLCRYTPWDDRLERISHLGDRTIQSIQEDQDGYLWIATDQGLYCLYEDGRIFRTFGKQHGFQGDSYSRAACHLQNGWLAVGGSYGLNAFDPASLTKPEKPSPLSFSNFKIGDSLRYTELNGIDKINLKHTENSFSIEFSAMDYVYGPYLRYRYQLEGFDKNRVNTQPPYLNAKYTNIPPGDYHFKVEVSNCYGEWYDSIHSIHIHIATPWYKQIWFICLLIIFLVGCIILFIRFREHKLRLQKLHLEKIVSERTKALSEAIDSKNKFFSIISHDLKNPIQSIHATIHTLYKDYDLLTENERRDIIRIIDKTSRHTNNLLDSLLLWVLSQREIISPNKQKIELYGFVHAILETFQPGTDQKKIRIINNIPPSTHVYTDTNMLATIFRNLLSNAIKFSYPDSEVIISISQSDTPNKIMVQVEDHGTGIPETTLERLFKPGFKSQSRGTNKEKGNGLGLIIIYEFIIKLEERIFVSSKTGEGSIFRFTLSKYTKNENN